MTSKTERAERTAAEASAPSTPDDPARNEALRNLKKKRDFKAHLSTYLLVNALLWAIWAIVSVSRGMTFPWPIFPMLGWGIAVALQARDVYGPTSFGEREIEQEMRRLEQRR